MRQTFVIPGRLDGLNEFNAANRLNHYGGNAAKRRNEKLIRAAIRAACLEPMQTPVRITAHWHEGRKPGRIGRKTAQMLGHHERAWEDGFYAFSLGVAYGFDVARMKHVPTPGEAEGAFREGMTFHRTALAVADALEPKEAR